VKANVAVDDEITVIFTCCIRNSWTGAKTQLEL